MLSKFEAFKAAYFFLEIQNNITPSEDIQFLLSAMALLPDGSSADPAMWQDWEEAISRSTSGERINLRFIEK